MHDLVEISQARREERRHMERENARIHKKFTTHEIRRLALPLERARKCDPRLIADRERREAEKREALERKQAEVRREEEVARAALQEQEQAERAAEEARRVEKQQREEKKSAAKRQRARIRRAAENKRLCVDRSELQTLCLALEVEDLVQLGDEVEDPKISAADAQQAILDAMRKKGD